MKLSFKASHHYRFLSRLRRNPFKLAMVAIMGVSIVGLGIYAYLHTTQAKTAHFTPPIEENLSLHNPVEKSILVKFKPEATAAQRNTVLSSVKASSKKHLDQIGLDIVVAEESNRDQVIEQLNQHPLVSYAEADQTIQVQGTANDTYFGSQWGLDKINAPEAWDTTMGSSEVKVAVLDTGIQANHEDLAGKVTQVANFSDSPSVGDEHGHGTLCAGIIAANTNNSIGVAGVAPNTTLMSAKVVNPTGHGNYSWYVYGIIWAVDNGADVISMSLSRTYNDAGTIALRDAVDYAWDNGVLIVASAGNNGNSVHTYPGSLEKVLGVGGTMENDEPMDTTSNGSIDTSYGSWVDVTAPSVRIHSTYYSPTETNVYASTFAGTSAAAPFVAGVAALVIAEHPSWTVDMVKKQIEITSDPTADTGTMWTYGRVNAEAAVTAPSPVADLTIESFELTDASGQVRTTFFPGEAIYPKATFANSGGLEVESTLSDLTAQFYSDASSPVAQSTDSDVNVSLSIPLLEGEVEQDFVTTTPRYTLEQAYWTKTNTGSYTARVYLNYDHSGTELSYTNNQLTTPYTIVSPTVGTAQSYTGTTGLIKSRFKGEKRTLIQPNSNLTITQLSCYQCGINSKFEVYKSNANSAVGSMLATAQTDTTEGSWNTATIDAPLLANNYYLISYSPAITPIHYGTTSNTSHPDIDFLAYSGSGIPIPKTGAFYIQIEYDK